MSGTSLAGGAELQVFFSSVTSQCCPPQLDAAVCLTLICWVWLWELASYFVVCPPHNGDVVPPETTPLHAHLSMGHRVNPLFKVNSAYVPFLRLVENVFHNPTPNVRGVSSERLQGGRALWFSVSVWNGDCLIMGLHPCAMSLSRSLALDTAHVALSY